MRNKLLILTLLASFLCIDAAPGHAAFRLFKKKEKTAASAPAKKKTPYEKFTEKKGLVTAKGGLTIYKDGEDLYLEIADSLVGKDVSISSYIQSSSDFALNGGTEVSGNSSFFSIGKTDSLILFTTVVPEFTTTDSTITRALSRSRSAATVFALPIKYRTSTGDGYVIKANPLFNLSDKKIFRLYATYFGKTRIIDSDVTDDLTEVTDIKAFASSCAVVQDASFKVNLLSGFSDDLSATVVTTLCILDHADMPEREADSRIGVRTVSVQSYDSHSGVKTRKIASRWDLRNGKKITVYIDTLLPASWQKAVKAGIEAWNSGFRKAGLGNVISAIPYPSDSTFSVYNPLVSTVSFNNGTGRDVYGSIRSDFRTGEILSTNITIPGEYIIKLHFKCPFLMGDVDSRYFRYDIPDDAICEVLRADIMKLFGKCLGLTSNYAGSLAYTPAELRNPSFTKEHGITGSVLDNVLFNTFAKPGDKERGLVTIIDRIGPYDEYAIDWLYRIYPDGTDEQQALDSLINSKASDRECLFVPYQLNSPDPRANMYDLGSEPFAYLDAAMSHLYYAAANSDKWLGAPEIPEESFRNLYVEWIWLEIINNAKSLYPFVGGMISEDVRAGSTADRFTAVPESLQHAAVKKIMETLLDVSWLDNNKRLMDLSGAYSTYSGLNYTNAVQLSCLMTRLGFINRSCRLAGSTYTVDKFLSDYQDIVLKDASAGKLNTQEDVMIGVYLSSLIRLSPVLQTNLNEAMRLKGASLAENYTLPLSSAGEIDTDNLDYLTVKYLKKAKSALLRGKAKASDTYTAGKMEYLIQVIDYSLGTE